MSHNATRANLSLNMQKVKELNKDDVEALTTKKGT